MEWDSEVSVYCNVDALVGAARPVWSSRGETMTRQWFRFVGLAFVTALCAGGLAVSAGASVPRAAQGVDKDSIEVVVIVADVDGLRAAGVNLAPTLTVANFTKGWEGYFDALGKINGRSIDVTTVTWDPADPTSFERTCLEATQDNQPLAVFNSAGYRAASVGCITVDNDTFMFHGDALYEELLEASGKNLVTLGITAEAAGGTGVELATEQGLLPKSAKVGLLSGNDPGMKAAGDAAERALDKAKYTVAQKTELNVVGQDTAAGQRDAAASVATMRAAGVDHVIVTIPFNYSQAFFDEATKSGAGFQYMLIDSAAQQCAMFGASRVPAPVADAGVLCVTPWDTRALPTLDGVKPDNAFEAKCRERHAAMFNSTPAPGSPPGGVTDVEGTTFSDDFSAANCTMVSLFGKALKKAGKDPTSEKLYDALLSIKRAPAAYMSNGEGGFDKNKPYFANEVHLVTLNRAGNTTPKDANGLYAGCPAPVNCWVPQLVDGTEWFSVQEAS